jgi:hypothetical protein
MHYQSNPYKHNTHTLHVLLLLFSTSCFDRSFDRHESEDTNTLRKDVVSSIVHLSFVYLYPLPVDGRMNERNMT